MKAMHDASLEFVLKCGLGAEGKPWPVACFRSMPERERREAHDMLEEVKMLF